MTQWTEELWQQAVQEILERSATDSEFRERCLHDAHAVIREVCGQEPPADGPKVRFAESIEEQVVLLPPAASGELSDDALEEVAGGLSRGVAARGLLLNPQAAYGSIIWAPQLPGSTQIKRSGKG